MECKASFPAYAKVNLTLRILGRRDDGFHALCSIVAPLSLHDDVSVSLRFGAHPGGGLPRVSIETTPGGVDCSSIGPADANLCAKALSAYWRRLPPESRMRLAEEASIGIVKRIPIGGGLGGGSADAAATLLALQRIAGAEALPAADILALAADVGSDVPALLSGGPVIMEGRGECVSPIAPGLLAPLPAVLANPGIHVSTPAAYAAFDRLCGGRAAPAEPRAPASRISSARDYAGILVNDLEEPVFAMCPAVREAAGQLRRAGAKAPLMSGSGATVFAICDSAEEARAIADALPPGFWRATARLMTAPPHSA